MGDSEAAADAATAAAQEMTDAVNAQTDASQGMRDAVEQSDAQRDLGQFPVL